MDMIYRVQDEVLKTVVKFAPIALKEPDNYEARANLMWASTWALNGFLAGGVSQMTSCHRMEHELSAVYDITHGHGLAILIPRWLKYVMNDDNAWQIKRLGPTSSVSTTACLTAKGPKRRSKPCRTSSLRP